MDFYQQLQLSSIGSKQWIKGAKDSKEKYKRILIYNFKVYLVMAFCVAVVTLYTKLTGQENSVLFCISNSLQYDLWITKQCCRRASLTGFNDLTTG